VEQQEKFLELKENYGAILKILDVEEHAVK